LQARAELDLQHAFVLTATQVKKVWQTLKDATGEVHATASCADHLERTSTSAEDVMDYENPRARQILRLEFSARSPDFHREVYLQFGRSLHPITLRVTGCEPFVSRVKETLADILDGMRPWYSRLALLDITRALAILMLVLALGYSPVTCSKLISDISEGGPSMFARIPWWGGVLMGIVLVIGVAGYLMLDWGLNWLQTRFFPVATFAIGQGEERYRVAEWVRGGVLVSGVLFTIAIGLGISTLGSLIANKMGGPP
jgi:hypothetical protein